MSVRVILSGVCGHMGHELEKLVLSGYRDSTPAAAIDVGEYTGTIPFYHDFSAVKEDADCIIDFSHHSATKAVLDFALSKKLPAVIATTGQTEEENEMIAAAAAQIPIFRSANMSLGVALLVELAKKTAENMPDAEIEIIEMHHDRKLDAPSGTALMIANAIKQVREKAFFVCGRSGQGKRTKDEIGIHSVRIGNVVGIHEVIVGTPNQTITLKHEAHNRALFAEGALAAAAFLCGRDPGIYDMQSMIGE